MQLSQLLAALQKVNQIAGDVQLVIRTGEQVEQEALTALHISLPLDGHTPATAHLGPHTPAPAAGPGSGQDVPPPPAA